MLGQLIWVKGGSSLDSLPTTPSSIDVAFEELTGLVLPARIETVRTKLISSETNMPPIELECWASPKTSKALKLINPLAAFRIGLLFKEEIY
jgi:hypothetical protein